MPSKERKRTSTWIGFCWLHGFYQHETIREDSTKNTTFLKCFKTIEQKQVSSRSLSGNLPYQKQSCFIEDLLSFFRANMDIPFTAASHKPLKEGALGIGICNQVLETVTSWLWSILALFQFKAASQVVHPWILLKNIKCIYIRSNSLKICHPPCCF